MKHPVIIVAATLVFLSVTVVLFTTCAKSPEKNVAPGHKGVPNTAEQGILGTWVSEQKPGHKYVFTEDEVKYTEQEHSFVLEGTGKYTLGEDGTLSWTITWYSGNSTRWEGVFKEGRITVEFINSWDGSREKDVLTRVKE